MSVKYFLLPFMKHENSENQFSEFFCLWKSSIEFGFMLNYQWRLQKFGRKYGLKVH